jgi:xylan 1,4-beta-xylosidase
MWGPDQFGNDVGGEFHDALAIARDELGARWVRAHGIFHDDVNVFSWPSKRPRFDFRTIDKTTDSLLGLGLKPVVELSFMPRDLARDPGATVFS